MCPVDAFGCLARFALGNTGRTLTSFTWLSCVMMRGIFRAQCAFFSLLFGVEALSIHASGLLTKTSRLKIASETTTRTNQEVSVQSIRGLQQSICPMVKPLTVHRTDIVSAGSTGGTSSSRCSGPSHSGTPIVRRPAGTDHSHQDQGDGDETHCTAEIQRTPPPPPREARHGSLRDGCRRQRVGAQRETAATSC